MGTRCNKTDEEQSHEHGGAANRFDQEGEMTLHTVPEKMVCIDCKKLRLRSV